MSEKIIPESISSKQENDTGLALSFLFILIGLFSSNPIYYKIAGLTILLIMLIPSIFKSFAYIWFTIANIIGFFISKIVLTLIFIIFLVPFGIIMRLFGNDNLKLKQFKNSNKSVFVERNHIFTKEDIIKPF